MSAHSHRCCECGETFDCNAPIVRDSDSPQNVCILVFEEGENEQQCDDCRDREEGIAEQPGVIGRIH